MNAEKRCSKVRYRDLSGKQKEIYNFQKISALMADYGFNCIKFDDDWLGADFIAYHPATAKTLKIQLKSRSTISKKYLDKDLWITFPTNEEKDELSIGVDKRKWCLIPHDKLFCIAGEVTNWLKTEAFKKKGEYSSHKIPKAILAEVADYVLLPSVSR